MAYQIGFRLNIPNINALDCSWSPEFKKQNIPWMIAVHKLNSNGEQWPAGYLYCEKKDKSSKWEHYAFATIKLISVND